MPDLTYIGVPVEPATPDVTPQVTEILDFDPDVIMFSAQGADCWNLVDGLGRLGWTPEDIPLVLSGACTDFDAMEAAGDSPTASTSSAPAVRSSTTRRTLDDLVAKFEAETYQDKAAEYGMRDDDIIKGFAAQGFIGHDELCGSMPASSSRAGDESPARR